MDKPDQHAILKIEGQIKNGPSEEEHEHNYIAAEWEFVVDEYKTEKDYHLLPVYTCKRLVKVWCPGCKTFMEVSESNDKDL